MSRSATLSRRLSDVPAWSTTNVKDETFKVNKNVTGCLESNETHQESLKLDAWFFVPWTINAFNEVSPKISLFGQKLCMWHANLFLDPK